MHSHFNCNYPFNFFYVTVLFVMNILPGYYRNWPRVGLLVSPDLTGRASPWCWFPVAGFRLKFFRYVRNFFEIYFALPPLIYIYTPMLLYHEMKRNKLRSIWDSTVRKNQVACWCVFVYNKSNAAILKLKFVELRHQTRSPVSLTDGKKIMPSTVFQLDELVRKTF